MPLPQGFQPRPCPFCDGRVLVNRRVEGGKFRTSCDYCKSEGPEGATNDEAWMAWNGNVYKSPTARAGSVQEVF